MRHILFCALALACVSSALAQHGAEADRPPRTYTTQPVGAAAAEGWRADLRQLRRELERIHPDPYQKNSRAVFDSVEARLHARIPGLAAHEIIVELERIVALAGDGHTNINLVSARNVDFHQLPVRFGLYADGIYIEAADRAHADAVGGRVVAFGGVPADSALGRLLPIISRDNDQWIGVAAPHLLNLIEVLHALRLSRGLDSATLTVVKDGRSRQVTMAPLPHTRPRAFGYPFMPSYTNDWIDARGDTARAPLYQQRFAELYWWEYLPQQRLLYIKWDQVQNRPQGESALAMFRAALTFARDNQARIDKVLLDIRNNTGGEGGLLDPIVREIVRTREVDEPGRLFVAIGPRTFSAGLLLAVSLERFARPILVGEPTGGKPVVPAGHEFTVLANSGVGVSISPFVYQAGLTPFDRRLSLVPRLYVRPSFADYAANRDPVMEAVLAYRPDTLAAGLRALITRGDTAAAADLLRTNAADSRNRFNSAAAQVNTLGYALLRAGSTEAALRVFRLNVRVHPDYVNGWDSLGEAYESAGMTALAIAAFEEVLRLEPGNGRAREFLRRLRAVP